MNTEQERAAFEALELIAATDPIEAALDPQRAIRVARAAIAATPAPAPLTLPPIPNGWVFNHAQQQRDDDGPVDGVWEIGFLDPEDDRFSPIVTVDTGLYYQDKDAEPLAKAIWSRLAGQGKEASK